MASWLLGRMGRRPPATAVAIAILAAAGSTGLALLLHPEPAMGAVSVYLLGVVAASAVAGLLAGIAASVACFLSLNYLFTEPRHTLRVANDEDVVALVVFLVVALIVGSLVSRALAERARAERNEREARLLGYVAMKVMSGGPLDETLGDIAETIVDRLRLARCEIVGSVGGESFSVSRSAARELGDVHPVALRAADRELGTLTAVWASGDSEPGDVRLLDSIGRQLAVALERAALDAQIAETRLEAQTNEARAALFSAVTHDLRTPLASIKAGVTSLLQEDVELDGHQRHELLSTVLEETDRLNRLLGNLLDLARVRAGALLPTKELTAVDEVVESVLHRMGPALAHLRLRTILREVPEVPLDPVQLDQVLTNLLDNAARHSPTGSEITVSVTPWRGSVQVRVIDQGAGIREEDRERVFEAFYRGDDTGRPGSGLGLAIARAIVVAHEGRIWIEGAPSGGTAVVFELPSADPRRVEPVE